MDIHDPDEFLKHVPELAEDIMEPDDCFPRSKDIISHFVLGRTM